MVLQVLYSGSQYFSTFPDDDHWMLGIILRCWLMKHQRYVIMVHVYINHAAQANYCRSVFNCEYLLPWSRKRGPTMDCLPIPLFAISCWGLKLIWKSVHLAQALWIGISHCPASLKMWWWDRFTHTKVQITKLHSGLLGQDAWPTVTCHALFALSTQYW